MQGRINLNQILNFETGGGSVYPKENAFFIAVLTDKPSTSTKPVNINLTITYTDS